MAAFGRGDIDEYLQPCAEDFAFRAPGDGGIASTLAGRQDRLVGIVILFCLLAQAATTFDLSADFSLRNNPNQVWQYGYSETNSLDPAQFRVDKSTGALGQIGFWHPSVSDRPGPGYYPYVAYNSAKQSRLGSSNGWAARAGEVAMEASNSGQYSLIRFVTPAPGTYKVTARFEGIHFGLSSTDVHVLHNATSLFDAEIEGYGGDPAFHEVQGLSPTADYSGQIDLKANDTVTFACGYGLAGCGGTGPAARCLFRRAPAAAGLYGAEETTRRSFSPPAESNQAGIRRAWQKEQLVGPHS